MCFVADTIFAIKVIEFLILVTLAPLCYCDIDLIYLGRASLKVIGVSKEILSTKLPKFNLPLCLICRASTRSAVTMFLETEIRAISWQGWNMQFVCSSWWILGTVYKFTHHFGQKTPMPFCFATVWVISYLDMIKYYICFMFKVNSA